MGLILFGLAVYGLVVWLRDRVGSSPACPHCGSTAKGLRYGREGQLKGLDEALAVAGLAAVPASLTAQFQGRRCRSCLKEWIVEVLEQIGLSCSRCGAIHDVLGLPSASHAELRTQWAPLYGTATEGPNGAYFQIMCFKPPTPAWLAWDAARTAAARRQRESNRSPSPPWPSRTRRSEHRWSDGDAGGDIFWVDDMEVPGRSGLDDGFDAGLDTG